ncbi:MAG: hypothetical protein D6755_13980, partial [Anaerolineae bacterium]
MARSLGKWRLFFGLLLALLALGNSPMRVAADAAPPQMPPGVNPLPGEETQVRMESETVVIAVRMNAEDAPGTAQVTATFHMRNLGTADETMQVLFPVQFNDGRYSYPMIEDLRVTVNGSPVGTTPTLRLEWGRFPDKEVRWEQFPVRFPVGKEVLIEVSYTLRGTRMYDSSFVNYTYLLETGAGWKDTIGSADIILRLPYPANGGNVFLSGAIGWPEPPPGGVIEGNEVRWHFDDLEPTSSDNVSLTLVRPSDWRHVLLEEENVRANPNDGEAWGRLGMYLKNALRWKGKGAWRSDPGAELLYDRAEEAYAQAVALRPDDPLWHAGYGELLWGRYDWDVARAFLDQKEPDPMAWEKLLQAVQELHTAYTLAPDDPVVQELTLHVADAPNWWGSNAPEFIRDTGDGFEFLALTATPAWSWVATPTSTSTPRPTPTATPAATATPPPPTASPTSSPTLHPP